MKVYTALFHSNKTLKTFFLIYVTVFETPLKVTLNRDIYFKKQSPNNLVVSMCNLSPSLDLQRVYQKLDSKYPSANF